MGKKVQKRALAKNICPSCDKEVAGFLKTCPYCQKKIARPMIETDAWDSRDHTGKAADDAAIQPVRASTIAAKLMACPDCEREISTSAAACPHCGAPSKETKRTASYKAVDDFLRNLQGFIIFGSMLFLLYMCS